MQTHWIRRTALFLGGQTVTLFGSMTVQFAISWHITLTYQSGTLMMVSTLCGFLPQVLISLLAGVWADRFNRKKMIILADTAIAACTALLAILFMAGYDKLWLLFALSAVRSLGSGVQTPAVSAFLTELVPQEQLMRVNGVNASIMSVMMLLSPVAAMGLYTAMGLSLVFWVDVVTAAAGIGLLTVLKVAPREVPQPEPGHLIRDMLSGVRYMTATRWLRQYLGIYLFFALMLGPVVFLTPLMVVRSLSYEPWKLFVHEVVFQTTLSGFGDESWRLMVHELVFSGGSIIGGVLVGVFSNKVKNKVRLMIWSCAAFGLTTFVMGFSPNFWFYLGVMLLMGVVMPFINTSAMTVLQIRVQPDMLGRVFGLVSIVGSSAMPLSMVAFGPLADRMRVEILLIFTGAVMTAISLIALRLKEMLYAGAPLPESPS